MIRDVMKLAIRYSRGRRAIIEVSLTDKRWTVRAVAFWSGGVDGDGREIRSEHGEESAETYEAALAALRAQMLQGLQKRAARDLELAAEIKGDE